MKIKYPKPKLRLNTRGTTTGRFTSSPDDGESDGHAALRRMVDPHGRLPFWSDFDGFSEEDFLGYTPGDQ